MKKKSLLFIIALVSTWSSAPIEQIQLDNSKFILTPPSAKTPRINEAKIFGVRPDSPYLFKIAATGKNPLKYKVKNLPGGLMLDESTGIITGKLSRKGEYKVFVKVSNTLGDLECSLLIKVCNTISLTPPMSWNDWNCWGLGLNQDRLKQSVQSFIDKGLIDHRWNYINIDDSRQAANREKDGSLKSN
jgi:alpha-galactosidase